MVGSMPRPRAADVPQDKTPVPRPRARPTPEGTIHMRRATTALARTAAVACAGAVATAALVSPRKNDSYVDARWGKIRQHRFAHRGLHDRDLGIPENSLSAFRRARDLGFGVELDVHLTADGQLAVIHDASTRRMCGRALTVEKSTLQDLRELCLDGTDERIPTFDEALSVFDADCEGDADPLPLIVEVKTEGAAWPRVAELCHKTMDELDCHCVSYCVESFDPRVLVWLRRHRPEVVRGQLSKDYLAATSAKSAASARTGEKSVPAHRQALASVCTAARDAAATSMVANSLARPDFVAYKFADRATPAFRLVQALGAKPVFWTIKNPQDLAAAETEGGVAIFEGFVPDTTHAQV